MPDRIRQVFISPGQAAQAVGLSPTQFRQLLQNRQLPLDRPAGSRRCWISVGALLDLYPNALDTLVLTTGQAAEILNITRATVTHLIQEGALKAVLAAQPPTGRWGRIRLAEVLNLERSGKRSWLSGQRAVIRRRRRSA